MTDEVDDEIEDILAVDPTLDENIDYGPLAQLADEDFFTSAGLDPEQLIKEVQKGLHMLDEFKVYEVVPASQAVGQELVSSRGEAKTTGDGTIKWRFVGREFKWTQVRDDVFSPGSSTNASRTIGFVAAKEQWPTLCADGISAYHQTPEKA